MVFIHWMVLNIFEKLYKRGTQKELELNFSPIDMRKNYKKA